MPEGSTGPRRTSAEVTGPRRITGWQAVVSVVEGNTGGTGERTRVPDPSYRHLLRPKVLTAVSRASRTGDRRHGWRWTIVAAIGLLFWSFVLFVLTRVLTVFRNTPEIGALLAGKVLGLVFISFFMILLLSNIITALSTFFLAKDLELLVSAPVNWLTLYAAKLTGVDAPLELDDRAHGGADLRGVRVGLPRGLRSFRSWRWRRSSPSS